MYQQFDGVTTLNGRTQGFVLIQNKIQKMIPNLFATLSVCHQSPQGMQVSNKKSLLIEFYSKHLDFFFIKTLHTKEYNQ